MIKAFLSGDIMDRNPPTNEDTKIQFSGRNNPVHISSLSAFLSHPDVVFLMNTYDKQAILAEQAKLQIVYDLKEINLQYVKKFGRGIFTTVDGRAKQRDSFSRKLYKICLENSPSTGINKKILRNFYTNIKDLCGIRFSCAYFDEVKDTIDNIVRPGLNNIGYATNLQRDYKLKDKDYLELGDEAGYRSYHFYVKIPTLVDIYGNKELVLCEVQARTELQHIWAVRSHDLLYKQEDGWDLSDNQVVADMKQLSNSLRTADQLFISIRERCGTGDHNAQSG